MISRITRASVRAQLIVLVLAILLPALALFAWQLSVQARDAHDAAAAKVRLLAETTASNIEMYLREKEVVMSRLAARPLIKALNSKSCDLLVGEYVRLQPDFTNLLVRDLQANTICSFIPNPVKAEQAVGFPWFKEALRRERFTVGDAFLGRAAGRWVSVMTYPIHDDAGKMTGVLATPVDLLKLSQKLLPPGDSSTPSAVISVIDRQNNFLMRAADPALWISKALPASVVEQLGSRREGFASAAGADGKPRLLAFTTSPTTGWRVIADMPEQEVFATYQAVLARSLFIVGVTLLLSLALAWSIAAAIIRPIRELARTSAKVAEGDTAARAQLTGPAEIEAVAQQLNRMLDIHKYNDQIVRTNEERWKFALSGSGDGVWDWNIVTSKAVFSKRWKEILGYTEVEIGDDIAESTQRVHPQDQGKMTTDIRAHLEGRTTSYASEHRMQCKDGSWKWVLARAVVVNRDAAGKALRMVGTISDLSERKAAEAATAAAREQVEHILESVGDAFVALDREWRFIYVNEKAAQIFGREREELIGKHIWTEFPEGVGQPFYHAYQKAMSERSNQFLEEYYPSSDRWLENRIYPSRDGISVFFHEVSERKRAETALQASEERYRRVIAAMAEGVVVRDHNGLITDCNASAERIMGKTLDQFRGNRILDPTSQAFREDGTPLPDSERPGHTALTTGQAQSNQVIGFRRQDGSMLWLSMNTQPLLDNTGGNIIGVVNTFTDITDRRHDEGLRAAKEAAELASRAKTAFLARMSHELRTPLNSILGFAQLLQYDPKVREDDKSQKKIGHILEAGHHLMTMVDEILDLSRIEAGALSMSLEAIDIDSLITECVALSAGKASAHQITYDYAPQIDGAWIRGDRARLRQILVNLLSNALNYNRLGGSVYVSLAGNAEQVEIAVRDTGAGLTPAQIAGLYQPFNRLGAETSLTEGSGIGLVIVKQLVEAMDGRIEVSSEVRKGSTFTLIFPRVTPGREGVAAQPALSVPALPISSTAMFTVLYVEDNPTNIELVRESLALNPNIHLEVATDGNTGLSTAKRLRPDLILLDINLPGMDGFDVLRNMHDDPMLVGIPCIALTANAMGDEIQRARAAGFADYITKPFDIHTLLSSIDAQLHRVRS